MAAGFGHRHAAGAILHHRGVEVLLVPELCAERVLLEHVHMVEPLGRESTQIFDDRAVGSLHVGEAAASRRLHPLDLRFGNLGIGETDHARRAGPGVAADEDAAAFVRSIERQELHLRPRLVDFKALARIHRMPAEMPDRGLRRGGWRRRHLVEQEKDVGRRLERRQAAPTCSRCGRELPGVETDRRIGIDRVEMEVMEARSWKHGGLSCGRNA